MAITKIHPIYKTLNTAIDYIVNEEKTAKIFMFPASTVIKTPLIFSL